MSAVANSAPSTPPRTASPSMTPPPTSVGKTFDDGQTASSSSRPSSSSGGEMSTKPTSVASGSSVVASHPKHTPNFIIGPSGDSLPGSREESPTATPQTTSGTTTPYSRPFTPAGEADDPYARSKR